MHLSRLDIAGVRRFDRISLAPTPGLNLITGDNLPPRIIERALPPANPTTAEAALGTLIEDRPPLAELERRYAKLILAETDGNKTRAAEILGIDRRTVYRLLEIHEGAESRLSGDHAE